MDFSNYIFRAHMVGNIISVPKPLTQNQSEMLKDYELRASGEGRKLTEKQLTELNSLRYKNDQSKIFSLTDGAKTILRDLVRQEEFGYRPYLNADEAEKGLLVEKISRDLMSEILGTPLVKDDERKTNDWVTGKRDIKAEIIIDIKSAFSQSSFSKMLDDSHKENEIYLRQMDSYMDLWGIDYSIVSHVLVDTPIELVEKKIRSVTYRSRLFNSITNEFTPEGFDIVEGIVHDHIITEEGMNELCSFGFQVGGDNYIEFKPTDFPRWKETPKSQRIHMIPHSFDKVRIEQRNECIKLSREYMNSDEAKPRNNIIEIKELV